jgi:hypothetical protein
MQLTRHGLYVLVLVQFLLIPFLMQFQFDLAPAVSTLAQMSNGPPLHYAAVRKMYGSATRKKITNHLLLLFHSGIMLNNARAFLEGILGVRSEFLRTPKFGISGIRGNWRDKVYVLQWPSMAVVELLLAAYGFASMLISILTRNFLLLPYVALTTFGLLYVGASSIYHSIGAGKSS